MSTGKDAKRQKEEIPDVPFSETRVTWGDALVESFKLFDFGTILIIILIICSKVLGNEVEGIHELALLNNCRKSKGEKQLANLNESIKFMSEKNYEFEKERQEQ